METARDAEASRNAVLLAEAVEWGLSLGCVQKVRALMFGFEQDRVEARLVENGWDIVQREPNEEGWTSIEGDYCYHACRMQLMTKSALDEMTDALLEIRGTRGTFVGWSLEGFRAEPSPS